MAGNSKRGKNRKNKEKSNPQKEVQTSDRGLPQRLPEKKIPDDEEQLAGQIYEKIENAYKEACDILLGLNLNASTVQHAMLGGGYIIGEGNIIGNIARNSIDYLDSHPLVDGKCVSDEVPIFQHMYELVRYWVQTLVSFAEKVYPEGTPKCQLLRHILSCKSIDIMELGKDYDLLKAEGLEGFDSSNNESISKDGIDFDALLKSNLISFERVRLTSNPKLEKHGDKNAASSSNTEPDVPPEDVHTSAASKLSLPKEFAHEQIVRMLKVILLGRKQRDQIASLQEEIDTLEAENSRVRADINASKVDEAETNKKMKQAVKREKEGLRKIENNEQQISKLRDEIDQEKENILQISQQLLIVEEAQREAEWKVQQERELKEQAHLLYLEEKRLRRIEKESAKQRLASLQQALEMQQKLLLDTKGRLMEELSALKLSELLSTDESSSSGGHVFEVGSSSRGNNGNDDDISDNRRCIMCYRKEVCLLFTPCAHVVVCHDCSGKVGDHCPCCQTRIEDKIKVYGAGSS